VAIPSPNYSSRGGATVTTIVLHTAEGATTYQSLGAFFANPASGVSSHVGIDDTPGTVGEYVPRTGKAWTAANANPWAVQAELCAFADWDTATWNTHPNMLANTAAWIAEEAAYFDIPITLRGVGLGVTKVHCPMDQRTAPGSPLVLALNIDPVGNTITSIDWRITSAPPQGLNTPNQWTPAPPNAGTETFLAVVPGQYGIRAVVTDNTDEVFECPFTVTATRTDGFRFRE